MSASEKVSEYRLIAKDSRVYAVDQDGVEIAGARKPYGFSHWFVYPTIRLTPNLHQVMATTKEAAVEHVKLLAELFVRAQ